MDSEEVINLKALIVSGFYEDEIPTFSQGYPTHELQEVVTAEEVTGYISTITKLRAINTVNLHMIQTQQADLEKLADVVVEQAKEIARLKDFELVYRRYNE